jgi:hypothetical protein
LESGKLSKKICLAGMSRGEGWNIRNDPPYLIVMKLPGDQMVTLSNYPSKEIRLAGGAVQDNEM